MKPPSRISTCPDCGGEKDARAELCMTCRFDPVIRFWRNVEKTEGCWLWLGWLTEEGGYGRFRYDRGRVVAHRFAYELLVGPIPPGLELDHLCRTRRCVNPAHLEPVTHRENTLRGISPAARHAIKTHCPQAHPYDETNTRWYQGRRYCIACKRVAA